MFPSQTRNEGATSAEDDTPNTDCKSAVPGPHGEVPWDACNSNYNYHPEMVPAIATASIFGVLTLVHLIQGLWYRKVTRNCLPELT